MKDKKKLVTIILAVVAVLALIPAIIFATNQYQSKGDGTITVEIIDFDGETIIKSKDIDFKKGDTLVELVEDNFTNVTYDNGMLMSIEDYVTPADWSSFISIYVDDEMSMVGINQIEFKDGTKISLIYTVFNYE